MLKLRNSYVKSRGKNLIAKKNKGLNLNYIKALQD